MEIISLTFTNHKRRGSGWSWKLSRKQSGCKSLKSSNLFLSAKPPGFKDQALEVYKYKYLQRLANAVTFTILYFYLFLGLVQGLLNSFKV